MRRGGRSRRALALAVVAAALLAVGLVGCGGEPGAPRGRSEAAPVETPPPAPEPRRIALHVEPGQAVEHTLAVGDCHLLEIDLEADRLLELTVEQQGLDVATTLEAPGEERSVVFDGPTGTSGTERLAYVTETAGSHRLEICAAWTSGPEPSYRLRLAPPRAPDRRDRALARGLLRYAEGEERAGAGDAAAAAAAFEEALAAFEEAGAGSQRGWTQYSLGALAERAGDLAGAEEHYARSVAIHGKLDEPRQEAFALTYLGPVLSDQFRWDEAREVHRRSIELARRAGDRELLVTALANLAQVHEELGETLQAVKAYRQRLAVAAEIGDAWAQWHSVSRIGKVYRIGGDEDRAQPIFEEALAFARRHRLEAGVMASLQDLGRVHIDRGEPAEALRYFEQALERIEGSGPSEERATLLNNLGRTHRRLENRERSLELFEQARAALPPDGGKPRLIEGLILVNLASLYLIEGDFEAAEEPSERAVAIYRAIGRPIYATGAVKCLAQVRADQGELEEAVGYFEELLEILETRRSRSALAELRAALVEEKYFYYEDYVDVLLQLHDHHPGRGYAARAFEVAEQAKARVLLDQLAGTEADIEAAADPRVVARREELEVQMSVLENLLLKARSDEAKAEAVRRRLRDLQSEHAFAAAQIFADYPGWAELLESRPATLQEIRRVLLADGDTQLVAFLLGQERSTAWIVGRESLEVETLPSMERLDRLAREAAVLLERSDEPHIEVQARLAAESLSRELLAPVVPHLTASRLILVKDGALHFVPLAALPVVPTAGARADRELLVDRFELVEVPSASAAVALRRRPPSVPAPLGELAILADPVFDAADERLRASGPRAASLAASAGPSQDSLARTHRGLGVGELGRLIGTLEEARRISDLVPADRRLVALGFEANRDLLLRGPLSRYRILHLAGHGLAHPQLTGLVLSLYDRGGKPVDGLIRPYELYGARLSAELVVLSACSTGLGSEVRGEGLLGLSRGFLYAGASQVLASLWDVDDRATAELMERFYTALLRNGDPPARALRKAQRSLRRDPAWDAPHYWAGFVLQGDGS